MFAKRTESLDAVGIEKLITPTSIDIFGKPNLLNVIEKCLLSVTITSVDGDIIGYGSFYDYPNIPEIDCGDDFDKLVALHNFPLANSLNSFFMHYFLAKPDLEASILMDMINTVFDTASNIHYIFLNSAKEKLTDSLSKQFSAIGCSKSSNLWYGLKREAYMPTLYIRVAKPDDMDDLTPIFDAQSTILKDIYGEFYIAEMIAAQNEITKCLVAEISIDMGEAKYGNMWRFMRKSKYEDNDIGTDMRCTISKEILINPHRSVCGCRLQSEIRSMQRDTEMREKMRNLRNENKSIKDENNFLRGEIEKYRTENQGLEDKERKLSEMRAQGETRALEMELLGEKCRRSEEKLEELKNETRREKVEIV